MSLPPSFMDTIETWHGLLCELAQYDIEKPTDVTDLNGQLEKRQSAIDKIQQLDAQLRQIAEQRQKGWPQMDQAVIARAENLIGQCLEIIASEKLKSDKLIEITKKNRDTVSHGLKTNRVAKGYIASTYGARVRPPVIVDDHA